MENTTQNYSKLNRSTYASAVLSYLVSEGEITFVKMRKLLGIGHDGFWYIDLLRYINNGILDLEEEWDEHIPRINVLVFRSDRSMTSEACAFLTGNSEKQPTPNQIEALKAEVADYDKWNKVLDAFKRGITK